MPGAGGDIGPQLPAQMAGGGGSAGDLQAVTDLGNQTTNNIVLEVIGAHQIDIDPVAGAITIDGVGGAQFNRNNLILPGDLTHYINMHSIGTNQSVAWRQGASLGELKTNITANRTWLLPDSSGALATTFQLQNGGQINPPVSVSATYTTTPDDCLILADATGGGFTISLEATGFVTAGKVYYIKMTALSANVITVILTNGGNIDGAASLSISSVVSLLSFQFIFDGTDYWIV